MARHNTDQPSTAHDLANERRMAHGTTSINPVTPATTSTVRLRTKDGQVAINDGTSDIAIFGLQADGTISLKFFDPTTGKNVMQVGKLPDGTYGMAVAQTGYDVADGF